MQKDYLEEGFKDVMLSTLIALGTLGLNDVSNMVAGAENMSTRELRDLASKTDIRVYKVEKGDSLSSIAKKFNVSLTDILKYNKDISNPNNISIDQLIVIPSEIISNIRSTEIPDQKPKVYKSYKNPISDSSFIDYMKRVENGIKSGWNKSKKLWFPHVSAEGGKKSIAYGHKLTDSDIRNNVFGKGITDKEAHELLIKDLKIAEQVAKSDIMFLIKNNVKEKYKYKLKPNARLSYEELGLKEKQMALDFAHNLGGLKKFPTFFVALLNGDIETMKKEYTRVYTDTDGIKRRLEDRNRQFKNYFLETYEMYK